MLINDSKDLNHSSKFTAYVVRHLRKKKKDRGPGRANHTYFVIRVFVEFWRVEINNIIRVVKYEYAESFKF